MPCDPANASNGLFFFGPRKIGGTKENRFDSSTLNKHAWVKQERILSRRILTFSFRYDVLGV